MFRYHQNVDHWLMAGSVVHLLRGYTHQISRLCSIPIKHQLVRLDNHWFYLSANFPVIFLILLLGPPGMVDLADGGSGPSCSLSISTFPIVFIRRSKQQLIYQILSQSLYILILHTVLLHLQNDFKYGDQFILPNSLQYFADSIILLGTILVVRCHICLKVRTIEEMDT